MIAAMQTPAPRIALIHATALAVEPIQSAFERLWPQARRMNLLDDSLSVDLADDGNLTPRMFKRFMDLAAYAKGTGCDGILFTCSAFGPAIEAAGQAVGIPTLKPNEAMFEQALGLAAARAGASRPARLSLVATFAASIRSMSQELIAMAKQRGQHVELHTLMVPEAMQDLAMGQSEVHDRKIAAAVAAAGSELQGCDAVMLAQFSMAQAKGEVEAVVASPVLSSPECAVLALKKRMNHG
jgi:maleate cis-trans isomerase